MIIFCNLKSCTLPEIGWRRPTAYLQRFFAASLLLVDMWAFTFKRLLLSCLSHCTSISPWLTTYWQDSFLQPPALWAWTHNYGVWSLRQRGKKSISAFFFTRSWAHQDSGSGWHFFCHAIQLWARLWAEQIGPIQQTTSWETQALLSSGGHTTVLHCKSPVLKDFLIISSWFLELAYYVKVQCKCVSFQVR